MVEAMLPDALEVIRRDDRGRAQSVSSFGAVDYKLDQTVLDDVGDVFKVDHGGEDVLTSCPLELIIESLLVTQTRTSRLLPIPP
jgi:hypothetical protein